MAKKSAEFKTKRASKSIKPRAGKSERGAGSSSPSGNRTKSQGLSTGEGNTSKSGCLSMLFMLLLPSFALVGVYLLLRS
ncbi:MAG: hypothetical protein WBV22_05065 [Anaerolineaceae bacterium]